MLSKSSDPGNQDAYILNSRLGLERKQGSSTRWVRSTRRKKKWNITQDGIIPTRSLTSVSFQGLGS